RGLDLRLIGISVRTAYFSQTYTARECIPWTAGLGAWNRSCGAAVFRRRRRATLPGRRAKDMSEVRTLAAILAAVQCELRRWPHHAQHCSALFGPLRGGSQMVRTRGRARPYGREIRLHLQAHASHQRGRYPETVAL